MANFFGKKPDYKYFILCGPRGQIRYLGSHITKKINFCNFFIYKTHNMEYSISTDLLIRRIDFFLQWITFLLKWSSELVFSTIKFSCKYSSVNGGL